MRFFQGGEGGVFSDVTGRTALPADVSPPTISGAWATDFEADGDLDVIAAPRNGPVRVLRNNGDGTLESVGAIPRSPMAEATGIRAG